ncbi:MAG: MGMT family protein [Phycisphaerae bacterium]|nr:MGMT family protein [Phycisphaerae bacterium]
MRRDFPQAQRQRGHLGPAKRSTGGCNRVVLLAKFLRGYYASDRGGSSLDAPIWAEWRPYLEMGGLSNFAQSVLRLTTQIPPGRTITYGELAAILGQPGAARAVGGVLAANPFPVLIPCHRVLGKSGELTGFSAPGGVATKRAMLEREAKLTVNVRRG